MWATVAAATTNSPLALKLTAITATVKAGSAVWVKVTTTNDSDTAITYENRNACDYRFDVLTSSGLSAPGTEVTKALDCEHPADVQTTGRHFNVTLKPGESTSDDIRVSDFFDVTQPGEYSVHVERIYRGIGRVASNTVTVDVTP
jgi:hypothetical protein